LPPSLTAYPAFRSASINSSNVLQAGASLTEKVTFYVGTDKKALEKLGMSVNKSSNPVSVMLPTVFALAIRQYLPHERGICGRDLAFRVVPENTHAICRCFGGAVSMIMKS
jgi:hypothetical protein